MTYEPKRDIVLIKVDPAQTKTKTGLLLAEEWKTLPPTGTVLSVGPAVKSVKEGDRVVFERYGAEIWPDGVRACKESSIKATIINETE